MGLIAQEVEEQFPEVVTTGADGLQKGLDCTGLHAVTFQQLKTEVDELKSELAQLRGARN